MDNLHNQVTIMPMLQEHWSSVSNIYLQGIATGNATFETECPDWTEWNLSHRKDCRLIAMFRGEVKGWTALLPISKRVVYSGVAEVSVYIDENLRGTGIGNALLQALILESEKNGIWTLQSGIYPENEASLWIHKKNGFREVGRRERIGKMNNVWRDVLLLERRSQIVGI